MTESILRRAMHEKLKTFKLSGNVIDLGSKSDSASYYKHLNTEGVNSLTFVDFYHSGPSIKKLDLEQVLPLPSATYDNILLLNVLEHIYNYRGLISECYRICTENGRIIIFVPFMYRYHADPNDYFRYTHQALQRLLSEEKWAQIVVEPVAYGPLSITTGVLCPFLPGRSQAACEKFALWLEGKLRKIKKATWSEYAQGYIATAVKQC